MFHRFSCEYVVTARIIHSDNKGRGNVHTLHRQILKPNNSGIPIPNSLHGLAQNGIEFRRSELSVVYAVAGMGKSSLALSIAVSSGVPTLYFSADTNSRDQAVRTLSVLTGLLNEQMSEALTTHTAWCSQELRKAGHIRWTFDSSPTIDDLMEEVEAFTELYGDPPALMVIDNATDVVIEGAGDEWGTLRELFRTLKTVAREYSVAVVALHHASDRELNGKFSGPHSVCPPRSDMQGKVSQVPALILSMASAENWMAVCPVKNRFGWSDRSGNRVVLFDWDPTRTFIADRGEDVRL